MGVGEKGFRRQTKKVRRRETYHIQCLVHEAMMNCSFRSLGWVLGFLLALNRLNRWCQIDLVVKVFLGLFVADNMVVGMGVDAIRDVFEGCLRCDAIGRRAILLDRPRRLHRWANLGQGGLDGRACIAIDGLGAVCVLGPGGGGLSLHAFGAVVGFVVAVLAVGFGSRVVVVAVVFIVVGGIAEGVISVAVLIVVLSRFASKDGRQQKAKDGLEDADDKGDHGVQKPRSLSTWAIRRSEVPTSYHLCRLLCKTQLKRAATRLLLLLLPLPVLFLSCPPLSCLDRPFLHCLHSLTARTPWAPAGQSPRT